MKNNHSNNKSVFRIVRDYAIITVAMLMGVVGLNLFLLPNQITMGGTMGIASIIYWGLGIPAQDTYFVINAALLLVALRVLGWRFCAKTIYGVVVFTVGSTIIQWMGCEQTHLLADQKFMACIVGGVFMGTSVGLGLSAGGSTGGSDVVAAIVHKYRDISLGRVIMMCDIVIISSSYLVFHNFEQVIYGYVVLIVTAYCVDQVVNIMHRSVQFFIISDKYKEIASRIAVFPHRGSTVIEAHGFYTGHEVKMLFVMAKRRESNTIFRIINEIDPKAFVTETNVIGVYGEGFDKFKVRMPKKHDHPIPAEKLAQL